MFFNTRTLNRNVTNVLQLERFVDAKMNCVQSNRRRIES